VEGFEFERSSENAFSKGDRELGAPAMLRIVDSLRVLRETRERNLQNAIEADLKHKLTGEPDSTLPASPLLPPARRTFTLFDLAMRSV
jgi:hypothetical protein